MARGILLLLLDQFLLYAHDVDVLPNCRCYLPNSGPSIDPRRSHYPWSSDVRWILHSHHLHVGLVTMDQLHQSYRIRFRGIDDQRIQQPRIRLFGLCSSRSRVCRHSCRLTDLFYHRSYTWIACCSGGRLHYPVLRVLSFSPMEKFRYSHRFYGFLPLHLPDRYRFVTCQLSYSTEADSLEKISAQKSKGEVLVFQRGRIPKALKNKKNADAESGGDNGTVNAENVKQGEGGQVNESIIQRQTAIFSWKDVVYDIKIKKETRRILDHVDGWVKPGTLTALMVCPFLPGATIEADDVGCFRCW